MTKKRITILCIFLVLGITLCAAVLFLGKKAAEPTTDESQFSIENKAPDMYTWEEYQALSLEEQDAFFQTFDSVDTFEAWMEEVKPDESIVPVLNWDKAGKQPDEYTWEEYQVLSSVEQEAFYQWFDTVDAFEAWMETAKPAESTAHVLNWDKAGKQPDEYTWEEYLILRSEEQEAFYQWFDTVDAFEAWMKEVQPAESTAPVSNWDKSGKQPNEYTWEEYQALSHEDQDAFFQWFDSVEAFEEWMEAVKPDESTTPIQSWDKPGKLPKEYTWEEYQILSHEDQDAFFLWFGSVEDFEAWMEAVKPDESTSPVVSWDKPGKLPNEYTWEEYQALSPEEQDLFYLWFDSVGAFEAWMNAAMEE